MEEHNTNSRSGHAFLFWVVAAAVLAVGAYFALPAVHSPRVDGLYRRLVEIATHSQPVTASAAAVAEDRHMDPHFESDLHAFVPTSTKITVSAVTGDPEASAFAQEIAAWLRANGWQHVLGVNEHKQRDQEHLTGTNLQINPKGGMELIVGPRPPN